MRDRPPLRPLLRDEARFASVRAEPPSLPISLIQRRFPNTPSIRLGRPWSTFSDSQCELSPGPKISTFAMFAGSAFPTPAGVFSESQARRREFDRDHVVLSAVHCRNGSRRFANAIAVSISTSVVTMRAFVLLVDAFSPMPRQAYRSGLARYSKPSSHRSARRLMV